MATLLQTKDHSQTLDHRREDFFKMCSGVFIKLLLNFSNVREINISEQSSAFRACRKCRTHNKTATTSFVKALARSSNLQYLNLSQCSLSEKYIEELSLILSDKVQLEYLNIEGIKCSASAFEAFLRLMFKFRLKYLQWTNFILQFNECDLLV